MKLNRALTQSLLMAASIGMVVPMLAAPARKDEATEGEPSSKRPPRKSDAAPVVPGTLAKREDGRYLALAVENGNFALRFLDEKKFLTAPQAVRALLRWKPVGRSNEDRNVLSFDGKDALVGNTHVKPPYVFKVYVTLLGEDEKAIETVVVDFRG